LKLAAVPRRSFFYVLVWRHVTAYYYLNIIALVDRG